MLNPIAQNIFRLGTHQSVAFTNAGSTAITNAFGSATTYVRVVATADAYIKFDGTPTAATTDVVLLADKPEYFVAAPSMKAAARGVSGSGTLHVTELSG